MKKACLLFLALGFSKFSVGAPDIDIDRAWARISNPLIMSTTFNRNFSSLPLAGTVGDKQKYWSSDYWARYKGGINYRWNASRPTGFNLRSPSKAEAMTWSQARLRTLSPSEKWDLYLGRYDYPTKREVNNYASPNRPSWEGICDGWAGAALNHDEPNPIIVQNPDGIAVPFGTSDIKALLSWYYAKKWAGGYAMMGYRCNGSDPGYDRCTQDMNAGSFHIVLSNKLGVDGKSFIADIDRGREVWNHLAYKFSSTIRAQNLPPLSTSAPGTVQLVQVRSVVSYVWILPRNTWDPVLPDRQVLRTRTYDYYLDLDAAGNIIGGEWISTTRPDFLWLERKVTSFGGLFRKLPDLLKETPLSEELINDYGIAEGTLP